MLTKAKKWFSALFVTMLFACLLPGQAMAADADAKAQSPIMVELKQFKVLTDSKGAPKFTDASLVVPGDLLEYRAVYTNRGSTALSVTATLPVPEAVEYIKDSAKSKPALGHTVALKDSLYAQEPLVKKITASGGVTVQQAVPYAEYRFVRWDLGKLAPGGTAEVSIRARVPQNIEGEGAGINGKVSAEPAAKK